jgi:D-alanyl-D-alanine dipeptidase
MTFRYAVAAALVVLIADSQTAPAQTTNSPLADIQAADSSIAVELRYAGKNNLAGRSIYPRRMRAMVRPEVLPRLIAAHKFLRQYNYRLKIWDAYRPPAAQKDLWRAVQNASYVANPDLGAGSLHSWGVAVDCTLADLHGRDLTMPTDFDTFTPAAMTRYLGADRDVRNRLRLLQVAMGGSGFYGFHNEWWHFTVKNWAKYLPPDEAARVARLFGSPSEEKL